MLMIVLWIRTQGVVVLFRYIYIYILSNTVSTTAHWVPASFLSKANLRLVFASALLIRLLSKVNPRYVALSVCCSSVSSNIIFMGFI